MLCEPELQPVATAYRVNPELIVSFVDGTPTLNVPSTHRTLKADPAVLRLLQAVSDGTGSELAALEGEFDRDSVEQALTALTEAGVLLDGSPDHPLPRAWRDWSEAAWFLHLASKDTPFAIRPEEQLAVAEEIAGSPPPPRYKCTCGTADRTVELPRARPLPASPFSDVLLGRRTCRSFARQGLRLEQVADLAFYTGGVVFENHTRHFGTVLKKCAPSPGARHGTELYLVLRDCEGVEPGVYHYCVEHHRLNRVRVLNPDEFLPVALTGQDYFAEAPLVAFFTCVVERLMWKYKTARVYRLAHFEAGHYCQNLLLTGTALGLGVFCTGALADSVIEEALGIDGVSEVVLYTGGAGYERGDPYFRENVALSPHLPDGLRPKLPGMLGNEAPSR